jgi:CheY-like chemotaxis protein
MTTMPVVSLLSGAETGQVKKRRVLLVDGSTATRDLRAETMRKLGMDVDCAVDISEARMWWRADLYQLVLINVPNDLGNRDKFCDDIRGATPAQHFAFLVGKPEYLADAPNADAVASPSEPAPENADTEIPLSDLKQRWGIMEASRRISAVRSMAAARTKAVRERPAPARDMEVREARRGPKSSWAQPVW